MLLLKLQLHWQVTKSYKSTKTRTSQLLCFHSSVTSCSSLTLFSVLMMMTAPLPDDHLDSCGQYRLWSVQGESWPGHCRVQCPHWVTLYSGVILWSLATTTSSSPVCSYFHSPATPEQHTLPRTLHSSNWSDSHPSHGATTLRIVTLEKLLLGRGWSRWKSENMTMM